MRLSHHGPGRTCPLDGRALALVAAAAAISWAGGAHAAPVSAQPSGVSLFGSAWQRQEARVNTFTFSSQDHTALDLYPDGSAVVAWDSRRQEHGTYGIYLQRFDATGRAIGGETHVNAYTRNMQMYPSVAVDGCGGTWVAWQSFGQDASMDAIVARRFDADFTGSTNEILVNQRTKGQQTGVVVVADSTGRATFVWTTPGDSVRSTRVVARQFDRNGKPLGDEFTLSGQAPAGAERLPSVAADGNDRVIVVWALTDADSRPLGIRGRVLSPEGKPVTPQLDLTPRGSGGIEPSIAAAADGSFAVAWLTPTGEDYSVWMRRFDITGQPLTAASRVSDPQHRHVSGAAVAMASDGRIVVSFNALDAGGRRSDVFARFCDTQGAPTGACLRVNRQAAGTQRLAPASGKQRVSWGAGDRLAFTWSGDSGQGDKNAANLTMLVPDGVSYRLVPVDSAATRPAPPARPARPHMPPTYDPDSIPDLPFGGDTEPFLRDQGRSFIGIINSGWTPPDPHLAVGPDHLVAVTNGAIAFFTKDGVNQFQDQLEGSGGFWGSEGATGFVFDPEAFYDALSGRFFVMAAEGYAPGDRSYALVAVSDDSDPNGSWHKYRLETTDLAGDLFDSPNMSVDDDTLYLTGDGFGLGPNYPVYTFDKASFLAGNPPAIARTLTVSTTTQSAGIPPVVDDDPPAMYMIEHAEGSSRNTVRLIALLDSLGAPYVTTHTLTVPSYGWPVDPPQQGTSIRPILFDARFWSVDYSNGSLWAVHHVGNPVRARWYEIAMNGWPESGSDPALVQTGEIAADPGVHTFFPSIAADAAGNAVITTARSSSDEFISMCHTHRTSADVLGQLQPLEFVKQSTDAYAVDRWGDYSGSAADPSQSGTFWGLHEYTPGGNSWNTWIAEFTVQAANDACENASVAENGVYYGTTANATNDGVASCGSSSSSADVWYSFTPAFDGPLTVTTCGSSFDTVLSVHTSCPGDTDNELACNDNNDECGEGSPHSSLTVPLTAGNTCLIRVAGHDGERGDFVLNVDGPIDDSPPSPDPMTFEIPPSAAGITRIEMTATTATDTYSPPVEYQFDYVPGPGGGGTDSAWQLSEMHTDPGLQINTVYTYRVRARDALNNTTAFSNPEAAYTLADTPGPPSVADADADSMTLDVDPAGNPPYTEFAINCASTTDGAWHEMYVDASGQPSAAPIWQTDDQWGVVTLSGLPTGVEYCWQVVARNGDGVATPYGQRACDETIAAKVDIARSCRTHGDAGEFCLDLGIGDGPRFTGDNVECRVGSVGELEFDVSFPVDQFAASVSCAVHSDYAPAVTSIADGSAVLRLQFDPPLPAGDCCSIEFTGHVSDTYAIATLEGSVDRDLIVNTLDFSTVKARFGQSANEDNFVYDVNADGIINTLDSSAIKARFGDSLSQCP